MPPNRRSSRSRSDVQPQPISDKWWTDLTGVDEQVKLFVTALETLFAEGEEKFHGVFMWGPPGCGKTMMAKIAANHANNIVLENGQKLNVTFLQYTGADIKQMWVGESDKVVHEMFVRMKQLAPCIVFLDEVEDLARTREADDALSDHLGQFLHEISELQLGVGVEKPVMLVVATNHKDKVDPAFKRKGRMNTFIEVHLPTPLGRRKLIEKFASELGGMVLSENEMIRLVDLTEGVGSSDIEQLFKDVRSEAWQRVQEEYIQHKMMSRTPIRYRRLPIEPRMCDLEKVISKIPKRANNNDRKVICARARAAKKRYRQAITDKRD